VLESALFLAILSPQYIRSSNSLNELRTFSEGSSHAHRRIFLVKLSPLEWNNSLPELRDLREFRLYDERGRTMDALQRQPGETMVSLNPEWRARIHELARDIRQLLNEERCKGCAPRAAPHFSAIPPSDSTANGGVAAMPWVTHRVLRPLGHAKLRVPAGGPAIRCR
jgi:hypothetical protein